MQMSFLHKMQNNLLDESIEYRQDIFSCLIHDLKMLFSSRPLIENNHPFKQLNKSILNYGIHDILQTDIYDDKAIVLLQSQIYQVLENFEPRLKDVDVYLYKNLPKNIIFFVSALFYEKRIKFTISWYSPAKSYVIAQFSE